MGDGCSDDLNPQKGICDDVVLPGDVLDVSGEL
jgi:hypothetical protein